MKFIMPTHHLLVIHHIELHWCPMNATNHRQFDGLFNSLYTPTGRETSRLCSKCPFGIVISCFRLQKRCVLIQDTTRCGLPSSNNIICVAQHVLWRMELDIFSWPTLARMIPRQYHTVCYTWILYVKPGFIVFFCHYAMSCSMDIH